MKAVEEPWKDCALEHDPGAQCVNPGSTWCGDVVATLVQCQSLSFGCFYKLQCQNPCICEEWKNVHCGGQFATGTCSQGLLLLGYNSSRGQENVDQEVVEEVVAERRLLE